MGYSIFKFGALYLGKKVKQVPQSPTSIGDIPKYPWTEKTAISFGPSISGERIIWIKPDGLNLLIADRVLLVKVSWDDLEENGFIAGKSILIDGQLFRCRLLHVGNSENVPNEWDMALNETGETDALWHWSEMFFWGTDASAYNASSRVVRGYFSARRWGNYSAARQSATVGFRPVLEPLSSDVPTPNINLDGIDFQLSSLPGCDVFCPILQPMQGDVFKDITVGGKVKMYTFLENGHPIHMDESVKDPAKLTLTDRYFGDEYLVPWVISNGVAVATKSMLKRNKS